MVVIQGLELQQLDVKTAFLNGMLKEDIYMEQLEGFVALGKEQLVCKLEHSFYGLKQAPRATYECMHAHLAKQQLQHCHANHSVCVSRKGADSLSSLSTWMISSLPLTAPSCCSNSRSSWKPNSR